MFTSLHGSFDVYSDKPAGICKVKVLIWLYFLSAFNLYKSFLISHKYLWWLQNASVIIGMIYLCRSIQIYIYVAFYDSWF